MPYLLFPFISAALYGLSYVLIERIMTTVNVTTFMVLGCFTGVIMTTLLWIIKGETLTLAPLSGKPAIIAFLIMALLSSYMAWMTSNFAIRETSALYTSMGEVSYPIFTLIFAYLIFGTKNWDPMMLVGGGLVLVGSFVMVYARSKTLVD